MGKNLSRSDYVEPRHNVMSTLEFFIKNDREYTITELKDAEMLGSAKQLLRLEYMNCQPTKIPVEVPESMRRGNEKPNQNIIVQKYSLTTLGREYYNQENPK